jgi:hypothetical protein
MMSTSTPTTTTTTPGSAQLTWGHIVVLVGAVLGAVAFVWLFLTRKPKNKNGGGLFA